MFPQSWSSEAREARGLYTLIKMEMKKNALNDCFLFIHISQVIISNNYQSIFLDFFLLIT